MTFKNDITKCDSTGCKKENTCWRKVCPANRAHQSYADFLPECLANNYHNYWEMKNDDKIVCFKEKKKYGSNVRISLEEFINVITYLKNAFDFEHDMLDISKKYIDNHVLFDYISTSSTYLAEPVWSLLNKLFGFPHDEDIFSWWCIEKDFGETFKIGDVEDALLALGHKFREPDLSTAEKLYEYCVFLSDQYSKM